MRKMRDTINYSKGMATNKTSIINMYIHGGITLSVIYLLLGLYNTGTINGALYTIIDFYASKLIPWPIDELFYADTIRELLWSHGKTIFIGLLWSSIKYGTSDY